MPETISRPESESGIESGGEKKPRRVFVEIGTRNLPTAFYGERKIGEDETYVGIDVEGESIASAKELAERHSQELGKGRHYFVQADAKEIPLADASADEVFIGNVFGDEMHISFEDRKKFLSEAGRILAKDGHLVIKETNTPLDYETMDQLLQETDFKVERVWDKNARPEEFEAQRRLYEGEIDLSAPDSYIIVLRKNNAEGNSN